MSHAPSRLSAITASVVAALGIVANAAAADLPTRLEQFRDLSVGGQGTLVEDATFSLGHLELKMFDGVVYPIQGGDGTVTGFLFDGNARYRYTTEDPADAEILEKNLQRTGNIDLLDRGAIADRVDRVLAFFARPIVELPWDLKADAGTPDPRARKAFGKVWGRVQKTYLEYEHFTAEARANRHGQYAYIEMEGKKETVGYTYDLMRGFDEQISSFRKFSGYDLRFFEPLSNQLIDGGPATHPPPAVLVDAAFDVSTEDNATVRIVTDQTFRADRELSVLSLLLDNNADPFAYDWESERYKLAVKAVTDGQGRPLDYSHRYHEILIELPAPVVPGETFELHFELEGNYIQVYDKEMGRRYFALFAGAWYPTPFGWSASEFTMKLQFRTRKPYKPIASGTMVELREEGQFHVLEAKSETPVKLIALFAGRYTTVEHEFEGRTVRVHAFTPRAEVKDTKRMDNLARLANGMLEVYGKMLSPYPFEHLEILDLPDFWGGIAPSGMALLGAPTFSRRGSNALLAHELAHQWFGHMLSPASNRENWLSESFAEYISGMAIAAMAGRDRSLLDFRDMHRQWWDDTEECREAGPIAAANMLSGDGAGYDRYRLLYAKGPLVLRMLHSQLGNDRFYEILRTFLRQADHGYATTADFEAIVEKVTGEEMDWFFRQWIQEGGLPEIRVEHKVERRAGKPVLTGRAKLADGGVFKRMQIPVVLEFKSGKPEVRWILFEKPETEFEFELRAAPQKVKIDPARNFLAFFK